MDQRLRKEMINTETKSMSDKYPLDLSNNDLRSKAARMLKDRARALMACDESDDETWAILMGAKALEEAL